MDYKKVRKSPSQFLAMTSLTIEDFDELLPYFKAHWDDRNDRLTLDGKPRQRISYGKKNSLLPLASDKLFFILTYLKNNPLQETHGAMFGLTQPQCNDYVHLLSDILFKTLKTLGELPETNHLRMVHLLKECGDVLIDGTERPVQRPRDNDVQKSRYSGKKNS